MNEKFAKLVDEIAQVVEDSSLSVAEVKDGLDGVKEYCIEMLVTLDEEYPDE